MDLLQRAYRRYNDGGISGLLAGVIPWTYRNSIRRVLPTSGYAIRNGVKVRRRKIFDGFLPHSGWHGASHVPDYEGGIVNHHQSVTEATDKVVIIGGGFGTSMVTAAKIVGEKGSVIVYEGSKQFAQKLCEVAKWNGTSDICEIRSAVVSNKSNTYTGKESQKQVSPSALPSCDVLEMDCEGAEEKIIPGLEIRPKYLIIEIHPDMMDQTPQYLFRHLQQKGYQIASKLDHNGREITDKEFENLLTWDPTKGRETEDGSIYPPVILASQ